MRISIDKTIPLTVNLVFIFIFTLQSAVAQQLVSSFDGEFKSSTVLAHIAPEVKDDLHFRSDGVITDQTLIKVCVDIKHPYAEDLEMSLIAPNGIEVVLSKNNGSSRADYRNTCYSTTAIESITSAHAPFIGDYLPEGYFSDLVGLNIEGMWTLSVNDYIMEDDGKLISWSLEISNNILSRQWRSQTKKILNKTDVPLISGM